MRRVQREIIGIIAGACFFSFQGLVAAAEVAPGGKVAVDDPVPGAGTPRRWNHRTVENGRIVLLLWEECRLLNSSSCKLLGQRFDGETHQVLDDKPVEISAGGDYEAGGTFAADNAGDDFLIAWGGYNCLAQTRIWRGDGSLVGAAPTIMSQLSGHVDTEVSDVVCHPDTCMVSWGYTNWDTKDIVGYDSLVDPATGWMTAYDAVIPPYVFAVDGAVYPIIEYTETSATVGYWWDPAQDVASDDFVIDDNQFWPATVVYNGRDFLAYWWEETSAGQRIVGVRLSAEDRVVLDETPLVIVPDVPVGAMDQLEIATNGDDYLFVWRMSLDRHGTEVHAALVRGKNGTVVNEGRTRLGLFPAHRPVEFSVTSIAENFFVVTNDTVSRTGTWIASADVAMTPMALPHSLPEGGDLVNHQNTPQVVAGDGEYLVVWSDSRNERETGADIYAAFFDAQGNRLTEEAVRVTGASGDQMGPKAAWNGADYLVVWQDFRNLASSGIDVYGARLSGESHALLDSTDIAISTVPDSQAVPAVAASGSAFLTVWADCRDCDENAYNLYGARIDADGLVLDPDGALVAAPSADALFVPAVAAGNGMVYAAWNNDDVWVAALPEGETTPETTLSLGLPVNAYPSLGVGDAGLWVLSANVSNGLDLAFVPLSMTTPNVAPMNRGDCSTFHCRPAIAVTGERGIATWGRYTLDGALLGPDSTSDVPAVESRFILDAPIDESLIDFNTPTVATNSDTFVAVYEEAGRVMLRRLDITDGDLDTADEEDTGMIDGDSDPSNSQDTDALLDTGMGVGDTAAADETTDRPASASTVEIPSQPSGCSCRSVARVPDSETGVIGQLRALL